MNGFEKSLVKTITRGIADDVLNVLIKLIFPAIMDAEETYETLKIVNQILLEEQERRRA